MTKNSGSYPVGDRNPTGTALGRSFTNQKCTIFPPTSRRSDTTGDPPHPPSSPSSKQAVSPTPSRTVPAPPGFPIIANPPLTQLPGLRVHSHTPIIAFATENPLATNGCLFLPPFFLETLALTMAQEVT